MHSISTPANSIRFINTFALLLAAGLGLSQCTAGHSARSSRGVVEVYKTEARLRDREFFFADEYDLIRKRRIRRGIADATIDGTGGRRPGRLVGLALSGGGIRSNAFNLGLLSGLHFSGALKYVDYLSSVSGGSWAAGNYRSMGYREDYFFRTLDAALKDADSTPAAQPLLRGLMHSYAEPMQAFKNELLKLPRKGLLSLMSRLNQDRTLQNVWGDMVRRNFLGGRRIALGDLARLQPERPLPIFNGAHDTAMSFEETLELNQRFSRNFPFEFAPTSMGTVADCGNTRGYCAEEHRREHRDKVGVFWDPRRVRDAPALDRAMAVSSSWLPGLFFLNALKLAWLEWDRPAPQAPGRGTRFRADFRLTDGGHSENLGGLPLLERGVDLMILSDATADQGYRFSDYALFQQQARSLLGARVRLDTRFDYLSDADETLVFGRAKTGAVLGLGGQSARVLYVKPKNTPGFRRFLTRNGYEYVADFLRDGRHAFPFDRTITISYPPELIRAYYLLGRYIGARRAGPLLLCYAERGADYPDGCGLAK